MFLEPIDHSRYNPSLSLYIQYCIRGSALWATRTPMLGYRLASYQPTNPPPKQGKGGRESQRGGNPITPL
jgi:hypothetical protein